MFSTLFAVPSLLATEISPIRWPLGDFMCPATNVISTISVSVSIYSMVALALERFVHHFAVTFQHFLVWGPVTREVPSTIKLGARGLTSKSSLISFASHFPITTGKIANSFDKRLSLVFIPSLVLFNFTLLPFAIISLLFNNASHSSGSFPWFKDSLKKGENFSDTNSAKDSCNMIESMLSEI